MLHYLQELFCALDLGSMEDAALRVAAIFLCLTVHETCHGLAAYALGVKAANKTVRPHALRQMLTIASKLSEGFPQARIDFYEVNNHPYFGEITLTSAAGRMDYFSESALMEMGKLCKQAYENISARYS